MKKLFRVYFGFHTVVLWLYQIADVLPLSPGSSHLFMISAVILY